MSCASCSRIPRPSRSGETGLDYYRDYAPHAAQRPCSNDSSSSHARSGKPVVIHTRAADDDTLTRLLAHDGHGRSPLFLSPNLLDPALERGWYISFAGNVTYKNAYDLRAAARRVPADRLLAETDSPYLAPQPVRGKRNEPAFVAHTYDFLAELRGEPGAPAPDRCECRRRSSACEGDPEEVARAALPGRREHPARDRTARRPGSGRCRARGRPGLGVLTRFLAERVAYVHAVEMDKRLASHLEGIDRTDHSLGGRDASRHLSPRSAAAQARREPAVQHRDATRGREPRRSSRSRAGA